MIRSTQLVAMFVLSACSLSAQAVWSRFYPTVVPPGRYHAAMAAFETTGELILFSGFGNNQFGQLLSDAWRLQGNQWVAIPGPLPPPRTWASAVHDAARQRLVLFGGYGSGALGDTWEWQSTGWSQRVLANNPPARHGHHMAYDRVRQVTVLYGGDSGGGLFRTDTWEYDGATWTQRQPAHHPNACIGHRMAFDPQSRGVLLYGGSISTGLGTITSAETWLWDGVDWQQRFPAMHPTYRTGFDMVTDLHRARIVLHGGTPADAYAWEWTGTTWEMRLQASPTAYEGESLAYDPVNRRVATFGGRTVGPIPSFDMWVYQTASPANAAAFGSGCASSAGVPVLANAPYTYPWLGDTYRSELRNLPAATSPVIFFSGFTQVGPIDLGPLGMPGCQQWVDLTFSQPAVAVAGVATWTVAVPNVTALSGLHLFQQGAVLAPGTNTLGAVVSNGLELTAGIR